MEKKLSDLVGDTPDTEIKKSKLRATVVQQLGEIDFKIKDDEHEVTLQVTGREKEKLEVGFTYDFYSPEKISSQKFRLNKGSYAKKLFKDENFPQGSDQDYTIRIADLVKKNEQNSGQGIFDSKSYGKI